MNLLTKRLKLMIHILRTDSWIVFIVLALSVCEGLVLTVYHQFYGFVPMTHSLNLFGIHHVQLPFGVSRLWDIYLIPVLTLTAYAFIYAKNKEDEDGNEPATSYLLLLLTWIGTTCFGIVYLPIVVIASLIIICILYVLLLFLIVYFLS